MTTVANVRNADGSHWYHPDGKPCFEVPRADGKGMRAPTLRDARKMELLPSVTNILRVLHKEALVSWMIEQAVLAVLTSPRLPGEADDAFVKRILQVEKVQDQEKDKARDRGTEIHSALERMFSGESQIEAEITEWVLPCFEAISKRGTVTHTERIVVGPAYAGTLDLMLRCHDGIEIIDFKSTKKPPERESWDEHKLQLSAYAKCVEDDNPGVQIKTLNAYISTSEKGKFVVFENPDWVSTFQSGFTPLLNYWRWNKGYYPWVNKPEPVTENG